MSCSVDGYNSFERSVQRTARKEHRCHGCGEAIKPGHRYNDVAVCFEGEVNAWKHCERCAALHEHLNDILPCDEVAEPDFSCGHTYEELHGELPDEVAALAFWLPGEPLPELP